MRTKHDTIGKVRGVLALLVLGIFPLLGSAQQIKVLVQNTTTSAIVIQTNSIVGRRVVRSRPQVVESKKTSNPILCPSDRIVVTVHDPRVPARMLARGTFKAVKQELKVVIELMPTGIRLRPIP